MSSTTPIHTKNLKSQDELDAWVMEDNSKISFGKFKNQPCSILLEPANAQYANWVVNGLAEDFAVPLRRYLFANM